MVACGDGVRGGGGVAHVAKGMKNNLDVNITRQSIFQIATIRLRIGVAPVI
jgi:hypothetical protein